MGGLVLIACDHNAHSPDRCRRTIVLTRRDREAAHRQAEVAGWSGDAFGTWKCPAHVGASA